MSGVSPQVRQRLEAIQDASLGRTVRHRRDPFHSLLIRELRAVAPDSPILKFVEDSTYE